MFAKKPLAAAIQRTLSTLALTATAAGVTSPAQAQNPTEEIIITGSRIAIDPNVITSSPVTQIDAVDLDYRGITRVEDLLNELPQVYASNTSNESNGATGTATIDLRGIGTSRTLVLTNGHRMGFGDVFDLAVDINQIPEALVERVEVLTGGASSTYGSDAVAGVVNFIMKRDFEGLQIDYQYSAYQHSQGNNAVQDAIDTSGFEQAPGSVWDGDTHNVNVVMGVNSSDGRGNITGYLGYRDTKQLRQSERDFSACALLGDPDIICGGSATLPTGLFTPFDGVNYFTVAGDQFIPWDFSYYNYGPLNYFQRPDERYTAGLFGHYEVNEHLEGYAEFQFMDDRTLAQLAPSGNFFNTSTLNCNNPLLSPQQFGAIGCVLPTDVVPLYIGRRNVEGGPRIDDLSHTVYRLLVGAKGEINEEWNYDAFANFSRTIRDQVFQNDLSVTRIGRALNVVPGPGGVPTCQSVIDGSDPTCVPWNVFQTGGVTREQLDYLTLPLFATARLTQDQYVGFVSGDLTNYGIKSPAASDGVKLVLGGEYRDESMDFNPDLGFQSGDGAGQGGEVAAVDGNIDVIEFFMEANIPLVEDRPFFHQLSADVGYRYSDYSTNVSTDTYKAGGQWEPVEGYKLRGGYSRASRFGNINELFEPQSLGLFGGVDPCATATPTATLAQCANSGVTAAQYGLIPANPAQQYNNFEGGNPDLDPEISDSFTIGAVIQPDFVPGLTVTIDYWNIEVKDVIDPIDPQFTLDQCLATGDPGLCGLIRRGPNGNLWIGTEPGIIATNVNLASLKVAGIDFVGRYNHEVGNYGGMQWNFVGTWLDKYDITPVPGAEVERCAGKFGGSCDTHSGSPSFEWRHTLTTTWTTPWDVVLSGSWRYFSSVDDADDRFHAKTQNYLDLAATYTPNFVKLGSTTLTMGVTNVTDNDPPVSGFFSEIDVFGNGNTIPGAWDALGRYFFFSVTQRF